MATTQDSINPSLAAAELLRRQRARDSLTHFALAIDIPGAPSDPGKLEEEVFKPVETRMALHHRVMCAAIQKCIETPQGRLLIAAPPGSAKSTYASVIAPAWAMGRKPGSLIGLYGYDSDIAIKQSRKARAVVRQAAYANIFPGNPKLAADQRAADEWVLTNGSGLMAAGIFAGITGSRNDGAIVDDPVANRRDADSPTMQSSTYNEFNDTVLTRLKPNGWLILIQTRWNALDLAGQILPEDYAGRTGYIKCRDGNTWYVLCLQAEATHVDDPLGRKPGEFIWPEWYPRQHWNQWRDNPRRRRTWSALFQQVPTPEEGLKFTRGMFKWYDPSLAPGAEGGPPIKANLYGASDYATKDSEEEGAKDFTEHGIAGMDPKGNMYFFNWWSGQKQTDVSIGAMILLLKLYAAPSRTSSVSQVLRWWHEGNTIDHAIGPTIIRAMRDAKTFTVREGLPSIDNKEIKLDAFHARAAAGTVYLPLRRQWALDLVEQLIVFPAGAHDDKADVCGLFGRGIDQMADAAVPSTPEQHTIQPFTEAWFTLGDEQDALRTAKRHF